MNSPKNPQVNPLPIKKIKPNSLLSEINNAPTPEICQAVIEHFAANPDQHYQARVGQRASLDQSLKRTTDLATRANQGWQDIDQNRHRSLGRALREFRQRYQPGEHDHGHIHCHSDGGRHPFADRQRVALWCLNDVQAPGGKRVRLFKDVKVTPTEAKLVMFPTRLDPRAPCSDREPGRKIHRDHLDRFCLKPPQGAKPWS